MESISIPGRTYARKRKSLPPTQKRTCRAGQVRFPYVFFHRMIFSGWAMSRAICFAYRSSSLNTQPQYFCM